MASIDEFLLGNGSENPTEESQEVELTAFEVIQSLEKAWINELHAPELLQPQMDEVNCLLEQMKMIEDNLKNLDKNEASFSGPIHKMELSRIRFMIASYMRLRLQKIQKHAHYLSKRDENELETKLTTEEATFLMKYKENIDKLFSNLALKHIPQKASSFSKFGETSGNPPGDPPMPNVRSTVFVKALEDINGVYIEDEAGRDRDEDFDMEKDNQYIIGYKSVAHLVKNGVVKMI